MRIDFNSLSEASIQTFLRWLREPHVREFWTESEDEEEVRKKFLIELPRRGVEALLVSLDKRPIGYIQSYEACTIGGGWWPGIEPSVYGIDQFIGEPSLIGKGIGALIVGSFLDKLITEKPVIRVIADPDPKNIRAIRMYQKLGFHSKGTIETPNGKAELMEWIPKARAQTT